MSAESPAAQRLRRPAFAKELHATIAAGIAPNIRAHTGPGCWDRAQQSLGRQRLVIPIDHETGADNFDFSDLAQQDVLLVATGDIIIAKQIAVCMCEFGARMVVVLHQALPQHAEFFYSDAS